MPERHQLTNILASLARVRVKGRSAFASMPMVAALAVAVSTVHGFVPRGQTGQSVLLGVAEAATVQQPAEGQEILAAPSQTVMIEIQRHLARAKSAVATGVRPIESVAHSSAEAYAAMFGAGPAAQAPARASRPAPEVRPPLKLSAEQRNIAAFVASKYRVALDDVQHFVAHAYHVGREFRLDPHLILAIMSIESSFNPKARSPKGAQGLMQVLTRVHTERFAPFGGPSAAFDPVANITVGASILKEYLVREGSVEGALKSYVGAALLPHDYGYGRKVLTERERIAAAARGQPLADSTLRAAAQRAPGPSAAAETIPAVARVAPNSGFPAETKAIPMLDFEPPIGRVELAPPASADLGGVEAVSQLISKLSDL